MKKLANKIRDLVQKCMEGLIIFLGNVLAFNKVYNMVDWRMEEFTTWILRTHESENTLPRMQKRLSLQNYIDGDYKDVTIGTIKLHLHPIGSQFNLKH